MKEELMQIQHFLFLSGILFQAFILARKKNYKKFVGVLGISLILALLISPRVAAELPGNYVRILIFSFTFSFCIIFFFTYINDILPQINELLLLSFTLIFWYSFLISHQLNFLILLPLLLTTGVIYISLTKFQLKDYQKLIFYLWFLAINTYLLISYFLPKNIISLIFFEKISSISLLESFLAGASFLYLFFNMFCFYLLFSSKQSGKSFQLEPPRQTFKAIMKNARPIIAKYSDQEAKPLRSLMLIIFEGGFLLLNYFYKFLPPSLLISLFIVISSPLLVRKIEPEETFEF